MADLKQIIKKIAEIEDKINKLSLKKKEELKVEEELKIIKTDFRIGLYSIAEDRADDLLKKLREIEEKTNKKNTNKKITGKIEKSNLKEDFKKESVLKEDFKKDNVERKEKNILNMIKVSEAMGEAEIVDEKTSAQEIIKKFLDKKYKGIFVSKKNKIVGLIKLSNLFEILGEEREISKLKAEDIMGEIISIDKQDNLSKAILIMKMHNSDCLAVMDGNRFLGVVTREKILNKIAKNLFSKKTPVNEKIETNVDRLLDILKKGETSMKELEEKLDVDGEQIEEWLKILENQKVIKIERHFGKIRLKYVR